MPIDRKSPVHLYIQIAGELREAIASGTYPPGNLLPTEEELCLRYGVSRYPMRQAMAMLVEEKLISRSRGKGTFVRISAVQPSAGAPARTRSIALVLPGLAGDFPAEILRGFERAANENGYATFVAVTGAPEAEIASIERALRCGAAGAVVFPVSNTRLNETLLNGWMGRGAYLSVIDRNPGLGHVDYVGSDNYGGGYLAAHHMHLNGFGAALFVARHFGVSSVQERFAGFRKGLERFGMQLLCGGSAPEAAYVGLSAFVAELPRLRANAPFAVFAENDHMAERVLLALQEHGFAVGSEAGVIGFDNSTRCEYLNPRLTSVAQNGYLIGGTAAKLAMEKLESGSLQSVRHILPTQLAARRSCGEGRADG